MPQHCLPPVDPHQQRALTRLLMQLSARVCECATHCMGQLVIKVWVTNHVQFNVLLFTDAAIILVKCSFRSSLCTSLTLWYLQGSSELQGVSKEALLMPSKARQLADDVREAVTALPQGLNPLCQAIAARGGPKPPPGMLSPTPQSNITSPSPAG